MAIFTIIAIAAITAFIFFPKAMDKDVCVQLAASFQLQVKKEQIKECHGPLKSMPDLILSTLIRFERDQVSKLVRVLDKETKHDMRASYRAGNYISPQISIVKSGRNYDLSLILPGRDESRKFSDKNSNYLPEYLHLRIEDHGLWEHEPVQLDCRAFHREIRKHFTRAENSCSIDSDCISVETESCSQCFSKKLSQKEIDNERSMYERYSIFGCKTADFKCVPMICKCINSRCVEAF